MNKRFLTPRLKRKLLIIALISLLLGSALELYTFGLASDFLLRWLRSFFVFFVMISVTVLAIVPGVNYGVNKATKR
ncbi:hypothetical protein CLV24_113131 [Pontibacter ummariensis]|uniref:DUF2798 domain-containing protein n=1 Tax=Pontibacter ummariensis TaxID=1610492 RepID=A0A239H8T9_9BACT|nr:DUF2798 domain-containing protein [Pontibacter ummariensis]PRY10712.1 hypothetical protein CLV24_113131 [Pontibacter ummariensis]SNS77591.1 hypothetical protein SAMN06296052_11324 [Pontibacter ummariensis]